jgi:hypothetical protein
MVDYKTGSDLLRAAVRARKCGTAVLAREIEVAGESLHQFAHGTGTLPPQKLTELANYLFGGAVTLDTEKNLLRTTNTTPPLRMSAYPPPIDTSKLPKHKIPTCGPKPEKPVKPVPQTRPGWA